MAFYYSFVEPKHLFQTLNSLKIYNSWKYDLIELLTIILFSKLNMLEKKS